MQTSSAEPTPDPEASSDLEPDDSSDAPSGLPEVWGRVPTRNQYFTGRQELLTQLRDGLTAKGGLAAVVPQAMTGLGGVGKTQIAIEYVYRYIEFYDVVWWIPADDEKLVVSSIAGLARRLPLPSAGAGLEENASAVLEALRIGRPYRHWLLIFDGADEPESLRRFLLNGTGHTLITSRNPDWQDIAATVQVDVFKRTESSEFLARRVPGIDPTESNALADALGDLPLALEQAGSLQLAAGIPVPEYLSLLKERASEALALAAAGNHPEPVTATYTASVARLKERVPEAIEVLRACAFFGPQPIPRYVLHGHHDTVIDDSLAPILREPILFANALGSLNRYSLARVGTKQGGAILVHRLVQALTRDALSSQEHDRFQHDAHILLAAATPRDPDDRLTWPRFIDLLPHYGPSGMIACHDHTVREAIRSLIRYQYMAGGFNAALELAEEALAIWSRDAGTTPEDLLAVKRHRGEVLRALGRYHDAYEENAAAMAEAIKELGPEHPETLRITNSHGADRRAAGDFSAAYQLDEDSVSRHIAAFQDDKNAMTLRAENNFALDRVLTGDFRGARELHEHVYQLGLEVYGSESHPTSLSSMNNLARAVRFCGNYNDAFFMADDNYAAHRDYLRPTHPRTLRAATDLVIAERLAIGATDENVERAVNILDQHKERHGESHPSTLAAATALVNTWREAGKLNSAIPLAEQIVTIAPEAYGADHPYWYAFRGNLALLYRLNGDFSGALALHETSVDRLDVLLGSDHPFTLICAMGLASDLAALGDLTSAQSQGQDTLDHLRTALWPDHPVTLACALNLALDLQPDGPEPKPDKLRSESLGEFARVLGDEHPKVKAAQEGQRLDVDFDPPPA